MQILRIKKYLSLALLVLPLLFLSGCLENKKDDSTSVGCVGQMSGASQSKSLDDGSDVLLKINGRNVVTLKSFESEFDRLLEENPQLKQVLPFMQDAQLNFFLGMVNQHIVNAWIEREGIDGSAAYQEEWNRAMEQLQNMLNTKYFSERHPVNVSDAEIKSFYEENKGRIPNLMVSQGGVKAEGVSFKEEDEAKAFLAKAKESKDGLEKIASDAKAADTYRDFKMINNQSLAIDPALRAKIISFSKFPIIELVKAGDLWWVVKAYSKEDPQYRPYEQVKSDLEDYLKKQKQMEAFEKAIEGYKSQFSIEINDAPLKAKNQGAQAALPFEQDEESALMEEDDAQDYAGFQAA